ncbi:MAG: NAD(P)-dependent oxidoreductase [Candidatus Rokubacteria bacterium]|nr:NAD(P)-dependent oxidoreductase [Candidatus Rokubacteria bacterium]
MRKRVLVTGLSGLIGGAVRRELAGRYELSALGRRPVDGVPTHVAELTDGEALRRAFDGIATVVHLSAASRGTLPWPEIRDANVVGVYNVYEAARAAGVARVVFASSGATVAGWERESPYADLVAGRGATLASWPKLTHEAIRPNTVYGASKVWGEALGRYYADAAGVSVICLRFGSINDADRPRSEREFAVWCSQADAARAVERAIEAPEALRYAVVHVVSDNRWGYRDLAHARDTIGYVPRDRAEDHR